MTTFDILMLVIVSVTGGFALGVLWMQALPKGNSGDSGKMQAPKPWPDPIYFIRNRGPKPAPPQVVPRKEIPIKFNEPIEGWAVVHERLTEIYVSALPDNPEQGFFNDKRSHVSCVLRSKATGRFCIYGGVFSWDKVHGAIRELHGKFPQAVEADGPHRWD